MVLQTSYALNTETQNLKHWNPFLEKINLSEISNYLIENNQIFILGSEKNEKKFLWLFKIIISNNQIIFNSLKTTEDKTPILDLIIKNEIGYINYINSSDEYSGSELMEWVIKIFTSLNLKSCRLTDYAHKNCVNRNTHSYISLSLISKLKKGHLTYYEKFGFKPFRKENNRLINNGRSKTINNFYKSLLTITWNNFEGINNKHIIKLKEVYGDVYQNIPFLIFEEFNEKNCKIFYDFLSVIMTNPTYPGNQELLAIQNFISKSIWEKNLN